MNGYWEAVLGAALGLPGSARPGQGPRPLADLEDPGLPVEIEELDDAPLQRAPLPPAPRRAPPPAAAAAETPAKPTVSAAAPVLREMEPLRELEREDRRPAAEPAPAPTLSPIPPRASNAPEDAGPRQREAPQPAAPEPIRAVFVRDVPLHIVESPPSAAEPQPALPPVREDRQAQAAGPLRAPPPAEPVTVRAEPLAPPAPSIEKEIEQAPAPMLTIEIGRIDVRIDPLAAPPLPVAANPKALPDSVPSLADYLARRGEAGR